MANVVFVSLASAQTEVIAEILVHGNHRTPDTDILAIAGLAIGEPADASRLVGAEQKLRESGRFEAVEVRRRYRSIENPDEILVVLLVNERARGTGMWMPILGYRDGYGPTYGARVSFSDPLGPRTRMSAPMTWGGERRAGIDVERTFSRGPFTSISATASLQRHVNPHFEVPDRRREIAMHAGRAVAPWLRAGLSGRLSRVEFGNGTSWHRAAGGHVTLDTRLDPSFPRNAIHATATWLRLAFARPAPGKMQPVAAGQWTTDVRGYLSVAGPLVLAVRAHANGADGALPISEQVLLGGSESLRGYRAGHRAGDNLAAASAELRLPLTSPLSVGRFGVKAFADVGTTWRAGERLARQQFDRGLGGGIYFGATAITAAIDVAWPERGGARMHAQVGIGK